MANIERRRKKRKLNLIIASAAAALVLGGIIALIIVLSGRNKKPIPDEAQNATAAPTETIEATVPSGQPSDTPLPTSAPTADLTEIVPYDPDRVPVRISDEQSFVLINAQCSKQYNADGMLMASINGSVSIVFVNNTDTVMYEAVFDIGSLHITQILLNGAPARYSVTDDSMIHIPFVLALGADEECSIYIEFDLLSEASERVEFLRFSYDTSFLLTAYFDSALYMEFNECRAQSEASGARIQYSVTDSAVHSVSFGFRY